MVPVDLPVTSGRKPHPSMKTVFQYGLAMCLILTAITIILFAKTNLLDSFNFYEAAYAFQRRNACSTIGPDMPRLRVTRQEVPYIMHHFSNNLYISRAFVPLVNQCRQLNKDFLHLFWTSQTAVAFLHKTYPKYVTLCNKYRKSDIHPMFLRTLILYHFGGISLGLDMECLTPFVPNLDRFDKSCLVARENEFQSQLIRGQEFFFDSSSMVARPHHPFMKYLLDRMVFYMNMSKPDFVSGPNFLTIALERYIKSEPPSSNMVGLVPSWVFLPDHDKSYAMRFNLWCFPTVKWMLSAPKRQACETWANVKNRGRNATLPREAAPITTRRYIRPNTGRADRMNVCRIVPGLTLFETFKSKGSTA